MFLTYDARYTVSDLMGRMWHATNDMRDAFNESVALTSDSLVELLVVRDTETNKTVYVKNGRVSVFVKNGAEYDRSPRRAHSGCDNSRS